MTTPRPDYSEGSGNAISAKCLNTDGDNIDEDDGKAVRESSGDGSNLHCLIHGELRPYSSCALRIDECRKQVENVAHVAQTGSVDHPVHKSVHPQDTEYKCVTKLRGYAEVRVGSDGEIPRWRKGSEVTYVVCVESFPVPLSNAVEDAMRAAIDDWQVDSFVTFRQVGRNDPATFEVTYRNWDVKPYACSFFPNDLSTRKLTVFARSLLVPDCLVNILAHEVGHILGLRHEFAHEKEADCPSVLVGHENLLSVMNYFKHPKQLKVQKEDREGLKSLYEQSEPVYKGLQIRDIDPETYIFFKNSCDYLVSSTNSVKVDERHIPTRPNSYRPNGNTTTQPRTGFLSFTLSVALMILVAFNVVLFLHLTFSGASFLLF